MDKFRKILKSFYGVLKGEDAHLRFTFITGVTRFDKVSIFSDLNNLNDISLSRKYTAVCGITQEELESCFGPEIERMGGDNGMTEGECLAELKKNYDGYHFSEDVKTDVYNPFSLLNAFADTSFGSYWFNTGTPTFLIEKLKESDFDPKRITGDDLYADGNVLTDYRYDSKDPIPLFYQTGYLTIKDYDKEFDKAGFCRVLAAALDSGRDNMDLFDASKLAKKDPV